MSALVPPGILCGLALGLGLWLLVSLTPRLRRPSLAVRIAPHVADVSVQAREMLDRRTANPLPVFGVLLEPLLGRIRRSVTVLVGGTEVTSRRLRQAAVPISVEVFRARQLLWATVAGAGGLVIAIAIGQSRSAPIAAQVACVGVAAVGGFLARDYALQRAAAARSRRMTDELPTVLEFLTLSLSAGEGILDALRRVSRVSRGELATEISGVVGDVSTGLPLADSLTNLARQLDLAPLSRVVDQITGALERGTPLADVLRAQAQDARDEAKRELLEVSGKKEVAMLIPLVFLILPVTIVFAIFPGIFVLQMGF
ncbi:type II secretion system F family protein [Glaciihabitans sp. dw_435]|uniref:type II secretion system F family protein n=1 Tax=Glaciihabitans sp. dw_435 TaxID=2720081 RepID=UPI001BD1E694|nr:type II secretion system F family protein [Glaciihabitans sp. dw_435]